MSVWARVCSGSLIVFDLLVHQTETDASSSSSSASVSETHVHTSDTGISASGPPVNLYITPLTLSHVAMADCSVREPGFESCRGRLYLS